MHILTCTLPFLVCSRYTCRYSINGVTLLHLQRMTKRKGMCRVQTWSVFMYFWSVVGWIHRCTTCGYAGALSCLPACLLVLTGFSLYFCVVAFRVWPCRLLSLSSSCLEMFNISPVLLHLLSPFCAVLFCAVIPCPDPITTWCPGLCSSLQVLSTESHLRPLPVRAPALGS